MATAIISGFGVQSGTDRTMYATWRWAQSDTKHYRVLWYYSTGDTDKSGVIWFIGNDSEVTVKRSTYTAPSNAVQVKFKVLPICSISDREQGHWDAGWSTEAVHTFDDAPETPPTPSITIDKYTLTATLINVDSDIKQVQFQIFKDYSEVSKSGALTVKNNYVKYSYNVSAGSTYTVRCRSVKNGSYSEWSDYSNEATTATLTPSGFTTCSAKTATSVYLEWNAVNGAETYDIEYTTKKEYFDSSDQTTTINGIESTRYEKTGLTSGETYFFRFRAVNNGGESAWSEISSVVVGKEPGAPTTWSSTTTAVVGEQLILYWVHNSEDGSSQVSAELEIYITDGSNTSKETHTIANSTDEELKDKTSSYVVDTSAYDEGVKLEWRVRTKGVYGDYGDWSVQRTVDIYAPPALALTMTDSSGQSFDILTSFPINIRGTAETNMQRAIGYHLTVTSIDSYETVDQLGETKYVSKGEEIYSRYFGNSHELSTTLTAGDLDLENNMRYKVTCIVSMNSGLTDESSLEFTVAWSETEYTIVCSVYVDTESYIAAIQPYCTDVNGVITDDVTLSVYRREFDGKFTEISSGFENTENMFVNDPHPALDYARYRVVAMSKTTGHTEYYDVQAYPIEGNAAIIQWNESWSAFDPAIGDSLATPSWAGSMIKLPYNIDISDDVDKDVELVEYIGREHPVSYHGTQLGSTSTWSMEIPKEDKSAIYALRRLQKWMGNAYVREPSGSGYWASVKVSFSIKHCKTVVPVTLNITRVEGGI